MASGVVEKGKNKGRFKPKEGSRFKGCEATQMKKGKSPESAKKICAFIGRKAGKIKWGSNNLCQLLF